MSNIKKVILLIINLLEKRGIPRALQAILLTGLILGTLYTFIVPPWWHYDEAGHFEHAWLIANKYHLPAADEYDIKARRKIAESMIENNWYSIRSTKLPDLNNNPVDIGAAPYIGPRLYYIFSAIPLQFVKNADMGTQNRAVRLGSVVLLLGFLVICWKIMEEIVPAGHPLQWMVPAFTALLPGFLDTMTAINDDVGAVFVFSLFLLYGVRIVKHGLSLRNLVGLLFGLLLCYLTKNTAWFAFILTPLVILQGLLSQRPKWLAWAIIIGGALVGIIAAFSWGDALYWYRTSAQESNTRVMRTDAPHGDAVIQINSSNTTHIGQFIDRDLCYALRGKILTLGAWMWAEQPIEVDFPIMTVTTFDDVNRSKFQILDIEHIQLTTQPVFHKITFTAPDTTTRGSLFLIPKFNPAPHIGDSIIYYDGIVLAQGDFRETPPTFDNMNASAGIWDGKKFTNLLRNGSAELSGPRMNPWVDKYISIAYYLPSVSFVLDALIDQQGTSWYFRSAFSSMYQTFWSKFAAGKVLLLSVYAYEILKYLTLLAILGVLLRIVMGWKNFPWDIALLFGLCMAFIWGSVFLRGASGLSEYITAIPWARYAFPAIIPTSMFICAGWLSIANNLKFFGIKESHFKYGFLALMISLNIFTIFSIDAYFSDQTRNTFDALFIITIFASFCAVWLISKKAATLEIQV